MDITTSQLDRFIILSTHEHETTSLVENFQFELFHQQTNKQNVRFPSDVAKNKPIV